MPRSPSLRPRRDASGLEGGGKQLLLASLRELDGCGRREAGAAELLHALLLAGLAADLAASASQAVARWLKRKLPDEELVDRIWDSGGLPKCYKHHGLAKGEVVFMSCRCVECFKRLDRGKFAWSCSTCKWQLCVGCYTCKLRLLRLFDLRSVRDALDRLARSGRASLPATSASPDASRSSSSDTAGPAASGLSAPASSASTADGQQGSTAEGHEPGSATRAARPRSFAASRAKVERPQARRARSARAPQRQTQQAASAADGRRGGPVEGRVPSTSEKQGRSHSCSAASRTKVERRQAQRARSAGPAQEPQRLVPRGKRFPPGARVFQCPADRFAELRSELLARGWLSNEDPKSLYFDLKWGHFKEVDQDWLMPGQIVNHFGRPEKDIYSKKGLTQNLKSFCPTSWQAFYPRAFDLSSGADADRFEADFWHSKAEAILVSFVSQVNSGKGSTFGYEVTEAALDLCVLSDQDKVARLRSLRSSCPAKWEALQSVSLDVAASQCVAAGGSHVDGSLGGAQFGSVPLASYRHDPGLKLVQQAQIRLAALASQSEQHGLNNGRNAWIAKPSYGRQGENIRVLRDFAEIQAITADGRQWICQKYIERPQLIHGYKFDIRQWVLVSSWHPLTAYVWKQPYLRFAGEKYDETLADLGERSNLTNTSITKALETFSAVHDELQVAEYTWFLQRYKEWLHQTCCQRASHSTPWLGEDTSGACEGAEQTAPEGGEMSADRCCSGQPCESVWETRLWPQVKHIVTCSLASFAPKNRAVDRRNTYELFGFDLMVSAGSPGPKVWLLEVNASPGLLYLSTLAERLAKDIAKVMLDLPENAGADIGDWEPLPKHD